MKIILFLLSISLGSFANAATGYYNENPCDIESYKDFIDRQGIYQCDFTRGRFKRTRFKRSEFDRGGFKRGRFK